jgi:vacuolar fusion protein MON1
MPLLRTAVKAAPYGCSELGIPGLRHFLYKSRVHVQVTSPTWDDEYQSQDDRRRYVPLELGLVGIDASTLLPFTLCFGSLHFKSLITIYQKVHDAIHAKSGQGSTLKLQYIRTDKEAILGWVQYFH